MANRKKRFSNIDEILNFVTGDSDKEYKEQVDNDSEIESEWEYFLKKKLPTSTVNENQVNYCR